MNDYEQLKTHRQNLHRIPETGDDLPKTKQYILNVLKPLDCEIIEVMDSGICAYFHRSAQETSAFRADMDALPIAEETGGDCVSAHPGYMHACGHDGHMAMALALAHYVDEQKTLPCNVLLIFQPAEETTGGAQTICETGILEQYQVNRVFGMHLWPFLPKGTIASKAGPMMPRSSELNVTVIGKTSHATAPEKGVDALYISCKFIEAVYAAHGKLKPQAPDQRTIIQFCKIDSGTARNIIAGQSDLLGTMRAFSEETFEKSVEILKSAAEQLEAEYDCEIQLQYSAGYPPDVNDPDLYAEIAPLLHDFTYEEMLQPVMISEDYAFYGQYAPAVFFLLGTGTDIALHNNKFDFDEHVLLSGFKLYQSLLR